MMKFWGDGGWSGADGQERILEDVFDAKDDVIKACGEDQWAGRASLGW